tara:strand:- start:11771 stop:12058 length:288 start_codon:yes stop_codon:yes gene_type:complete
MTAEIIGDDYPTYEDFVNMRQPKIYTRFKLEECITALYQISEDIEAMMHKEFDTEEGLTEDGKMNILIGMMELHKVRCDATKECMEGLIKQGDLK